MGNGSGRSCRPRAGGRRPSSRGSSCWWSTRASTGRRTGWRRRGGSRRRGCWPAGWPPDRGEGRPAGEIVLLTRATTDLRAYERALEDAGVATYVIGGRGYWSHPQVVQLVGYLRALANPLDQEALYGTLLSPLCGLSLDGLVLYAAGAAERDVAGRPAGARRFESGSRRSGRRRRASAPRS